jgi:hypothetical protein
VHSTTDRKPAEQSIHDGCPISSSFLPVKKQRFSWAYFRDFRSKNRQLTPFAGSQPTLLLFERKRKSRGMHGRNKGLQGLLWVGCGLSTRDSRGSRRLSKPLDFLPKIAVANILTFGAPVQTGKE